LEFTRILESPVVQNGECAVPFEAHHHRHRLTLYTPKAIIVPHRIIRSWYTGRWWVGCYIWYSEEGPGRAAAPQSPLLAVPNVTAHPSTASVPIAVLLYDGPLLCGFNVAIKRLMNFDKTKGNNII